MMTNRIRTYSELITLKTFNERLQYLRLSGALGVSTFGFDRYLNQGFYQSSEWRRVRREVIIRDNGCDLGIDGMEIENAIRVHHMNPITIDDIELGNPDILNPEFLISSSLNTHNAIHFGRSGNITSPMVIRQKGDTSPWKVY